MTCEIIIRPEAAVDIEHAFNWFEEKHQGLGVQCLTAVDACLTAIANMPFAYPVVFNEKIPLLFVLCCQRRPNHCCGLSACQAQSYRMDAARRSSGLKLVADDLHPSLY